MQFYILSFVSVLPGHQLNKEVSESLHSIHITYLLSESGLLWIGTSAGFILTVPLPRLEGVPQIKGRPTVSYHGHNGPVRFLLAAHCSTIPIRLDSKSVDSQENQCAEMRSGEPSTADQSDDDVNGKVTEQQWASSPDLSCPDVDEDRENLVCSLYDSLLRGVDADFDSELTGLSEIVRRRGNGGLRRPTTLHHNINVVSSRVMNRLSQVVAKGQRMSGAKFGHSNVVVPAADHQHDSHFTGTISEESDVASCDLERASVDISLSSGQACEAFDRKTPVMSSYRRITVPTNSSMVASNLVHVSSNKSLIIVSGGDGYVGWGENKYSDKSCDDTNLLLWKC
jgi:hypothetical protein